jgi:hypothetical protein
MRVARISREPPADAILRITSGNTPLIGGAGANDNPASAVDITVLDDFLFAEPRAVPEAPALFATAVALMLLALARRRGPIGRPA